MVVAHWMAGGGRALAPRPPVPTVAGPLEEALEQEGGLPVGSSAVRLEAGQQRLGLAWAEIAPDPGVVHPLGDDVGRDLGMELEPRCGCRR